MIATGIRDLILGLEEGDRAEAASILIDSLDAADPHDTGLDSLSEAKLRGAELDSGAVRALSADEFWTGLRHG